MNNVPKGFIEVSTERDNKYCIKLDSIIGFFPSREKTGIVTSLEKFVVTADMEYNEFKTFYAQALADLNPGV